MIPLPTLTRGFFLCVLYSIILMFQVYDFDNDYQVGIYDDYSEADTICDEYVSNYGEDVEVLIVEL